MPLGPPGTPGLRVMIQSRVRPIVAGLYFNLRKIPDGPGNGGRVCTFEIELESGRNHVGHRIVLLGQDVEDDPFPRPPLFIPRENRKGSVARENLTRSPLLASNVRAVPFRTTT